jgi:hypothetical protein
MAIEAVTALFFTAITDNIDYRSRQRLHFLFLSLLYSQKACSLKFATFEHYLCGSRSFTASVFVPAKF